MATTHSPSDDIIYNLVSVQYHALKAAQAYDSYVQDAEGTTTSGRSSSSARSKTRNARRSATSYSDSSPATVG